MLVKLIENEPVFAIEDNLVGKFIVISKLPHEIVFRSIEGNTVVTNPHNESLKTIVGRLNRYLDPHDQYYLLTNTVAMPGYLCTAISKVENPGNSSVVGIWIRGDRNRLLTISHSDKDDIVRRILILRYRFGIEEDLDISSANTEVWNRPRIIVSARPPPPLLPVLTRQDDVIPVRKRKNEN